MDPFPRLTPAANATKAQGRLDDKIKSMLELDDDEDIMEWIVDTTTHVDDTDMSGQTALIFCARHGSCRCLQLLIDAGADLNAQTDLGATGTYVGVQEGQQAAVELLVKAGADLDKRLWNGATALHIASRSGNHQCARILVQAGASMSPVIRMTSADKNGASPLSIATFGDQRQVMDVLWAAGAPDASLDREAFEIYMLWKEVM